MKALVKHNNRAVILLLLVTVLFCSCQNRNHVTHNKRKYNKGYYQPQHKKLKHFEKNESSNSEVISQKSDPKQKSPKTHDQENSTAERSFENTDDQVKEGKEDSPVSKTEQTKTKLFEKEQNIKTSSDQKTEVDESLNSGNTKNKNSKTRTFKTFQNESDVWDKSGSKWIFVLSWVFIPSSVLFFFGAVLILVSMARWLAIVVFAVFFFMVIFGIIINFKNFKETKSAGDNNSLKKVSIFFIVAFSILLALSLALILIVFFSVW